MSANSGPIQVQPVGLLGALSLKNMGKNPDVLIGSVQPTLDLQEWLLVQNRESLSATAVPVTGFASIFIPMTAGDSMTVPDNEYWYVWSHTVSVGLPAGDTVESLAAMVGISGSTTGHHVNGQAIGTLLGRALKVVSAPAGGQVRRWFGPGSVFGAGGGQYTIAVPGTVSLTCALEITRLPF